MRKRAGIFVNPHIFVLEDRLLALASPTTSSRSSRQPRVDQDIADIEHIEQWRADSAHAQLGQVVILTAAPFIAVMYST